MENSYTTSVMEESTVATPVITETKPKKKPTTKKTNTETEEAGSMDPKPKRKSTPKKKAETVLPIVTSTNTVQEPSMNEFIDTLITSFVKKLEIKTEAEPTKLSHPPKLLYNFIHDLHSNKIINEQTYINMLVYIHRPEFIATKENSIPIQPKKETRTVDDLEEVVEEIITFEYIQDGKLYLKDGNDNLYERLPPHRFLRNIHDDV
jgi:hypothetical protein